MSTSASPNMETEEAKPLEVSGSNKHIFTYDLSMDPEDFRGTYGVKPVRSFPAYIKGFTVAFTRKGFAYADPVHANLIQCSDVAMSKNLSESIKDTKGVVHGIVHEVSKDDMQRVIARGTETHFCAFVACRAVTYKNEGLYAVTMVGHKRSGSVFDWKENIGRKGRVQNPVPSSWYIERLSGIAEKADLDKEYICLMRKCLTFESSDSQRKWAERWVSFRKGCGRWGLAPLVVWVNDVAWLFSENYGLFTVLCCFFAFIIIASIVIIQFQKGYRAYRLGASVDSSASFESDPMGGASGGMDLGFGPTEKIPLDVGGEGEPPRVVELGAHEGEL
uniref:Uncharacterized protein n=1 Tax=Chromera velia CCMP2878 TaxID=1169474 RepID=A0A0G4FA91_9ALVE|eukprot:Cvel_15859.t1-p1 / transcript=Cvel_15859.t1 / gene=Cvel_15859 / organism=Chromera_velia_CCMP2878 / gene_product=hypothetical protein / transcript_product=hypothetical protein / location=Cvel_scaffold1195:44291-45286(+) / protein_length=332 / sequence_SO=supercontig / SO=protein_coding / is_pseudo=false